MQYYLWKYLPPISMDWSLGDLCICWHLSAQLEDIPSPAIQLESCILHTRNNIMVCSMKQEKSDYVNVWIDTFKFDFTYCFSENSWCYICQSHRLVDELQVKSVSSAKFLRSHHQTLIASPGMWISLIYIPSMLDKIFYFPSFWWLLHALPAVLKTR